LLHIVHLLRAAEFLREQSGTPHLKLLLNYDQALGHLLLHDLLIAHGGLRHLQDTVQGSEVGPCLPEFTLLTRLFLLHLADCAVANRCEPCNLHLRLLKTVFPLDIQ